MEDLENDLENDIDDVKLTDDQILIKILNDRICNIDKSITSINKTINMLISDINNIKFVLNSTNNKIILNNVKYNHI